MKNIMNLITLLETNGFFDPQSAHVLKSTLITMQLDKDIHETDILPIADEANSADLTGLMFDMNWMSGKFKDYAPKLSARACFLEAEYPESGRCTFKRSRKIYFVYMKIFDIFAFNKSI